MNQTGFDPKKFYFSLEGRIGRADYWQKFVLPVIALYLLVGFVAKNSPTIAPIVSITLNLAILWPSIAVSGKRWHDRDKSAWWICIGLFPILGAIWALVENGFLKGTEGANRFGPPVV